jgi:hypothetical protein
VLSEDRQRLPCEWVGWCELRSGEECAVRRLPSDNSPPEAGWELFIGDEKKTVLLEAGRGHSQGLKGDCSDAVEE